jgi:hypothetical protein
MSKHGTVIENSKWKIKVYSPPREHGSPHVHIIAKGKRAEAKIYLKTLELEGKTQFSKCAIKEIIKYLYENYDLLMKSWEDLHEKTK